MKKRAARGSRTQASSVATELPEAIRQLVMPMVAGMEVAKTGLLAFVHAVGRAALSEVFEEEVTRVVGPKGKRVADRKAHRWGTTKTPLPFGGRDIVVERPRVRRKDGREVRLPLIEELRRHDPLPDRVAEQIVLGVSTRGYERSLEPVAAGTKTRRTKKSSASRALVEKTTQRMGTFLGRRLDKVDLIALFVDAIEVANHAVVVALGVTTDGTKVPLGLWLGSTENAVICTALVQNLVDRGLKIEDKILCVIDGGKGIRKALLDVLGDRAVIQRCQCHKLRNVRDHLPESRKGYVSGQMREAYKSKSVRVAKRRLLQLASWLAKNGEDDAAASLREGLDETLTVLKLELPPKIARFFATTNPIENLNGTIRRITRNVKRWRGGTMIRRWVALAIVEGQKKFRRVKGHAHMKALVHALRPDAAVTVDEEAKVA
jgi:transposase-like protein